MQERLERLTSIKEKHKTTTDLVVAALIIGAYTDHDIAILALENACDCGFLSKRKARRILSIGGISALHDGPLAKNWIKPVPQPEV